MRSRDVLLVEDEAGIRVALASYLRLHGIRVREAACVASARAQLAEARPSALLSDERLGCESGLDIVREYMEHESASDVAICTADLHVELRRFLDAHPAIKCFPKPVAPRLLLDWLVDRSATEEGSGARGDRGGREDSDVIASLDLESSWRERVESVVRIVGRDRIELVECEDVWVRMLVRDGYEASGFPRGCELWPLPRAGKVSIRVYRDQNLPSNRAIGMLGEESARRMLWSNGEAREA